MNVKLRFTNPATHDGDCAQSIYLSIPLHVDKEKEVKSLDEYGTETSTIEIVTEKISMFQIDRKRTIEVKIDLYNKGVIADLVKDGVFTFVDATEQSILDALQEPKVKIEK